MPVAKAFGDGSSMTWAAGVDSPSPMAGSCLALEFHVDLQPRFGRAIAALHRAVERPDHDERQHNDPRQ
jgi:hypothetical protein